MKKILLFLLFVTSTINVTAQSLEQKLKAQSLENSKKLEVFLNNNYNNRKTFSLENREILESTLAGFHNGLPYFWTIDDHRANNASNVDILQNGSVAGFNKAIDGNGINIMVMDEGMIFEKHEEFGNANRITQKEINVSYNSHATSVAGIIGAKGLLVFPQPEHAHRSIKGVLSNNTFTSYSFKGTNLGNNYQKLLSSKANISNHSYGIVLGWKWNNNAWCYSDYIDGTSAGAYSENDAYFDQIVYENPNQIVIKSAGNSYGAGPDDGDASTKYKSSGSNCVPFEPGDVLPPKNCSEGYYCIGFGSVAKNIIVVGSVKQLTTQNNRYTKVSDVTKSSFSSAGPRKDGAIKPDITAVGEDMTVAAYVNNNKTNSAGIGQGTSYSAPVISGIVGALTQVNRQLTGNNNFTFMADEMKTLLIHTANEAGNIGPDVWYGWGIADAKKAAELLLNKTNGEAVLERKILRNKELYQIEYTAIAGQPLKASISWIDPAAQKTSDFVNDHSSKLINDLELKIIDTETNQVYYPWRLDVSNPMTPAKRDGENKVDNVEQVLIDNPVSGRKYIVEVSHKGRLVNNNGHESDQNYALIVTGLEKINPPAKIDAAVKIYPTLVKDYLYIDVPAGTRYQSAALYNLSGNKIMDLDQSTFNLSKVLKGIYIIQIKTDKGITNKKIIKE